MRWLIFGCTVLLGVLVPVSSDKQPVSLANVLSPSGRFMFPLIEISVPDLINGILSTFRYFWTRFQWLFGLSDSTIVGAKDPPVPIPSAALKAVPLAPEPFVCSPIKTVSVEVDDPVRHPYLHKSKVIRRKKRKKRRKEHLGKVAIDWDMVAAQAWALL
ncbi:uncharacterized protein LOC128266890 [Anopheles cruzii]|uniref:uncharacterized protein LOC128266890 n=1 Tax=Anopheles cruzii TaxID=68878 RepID=UPI0022EC255A|nr:uncharacterized protein LOC128266890 [Anopheles cruzii]